MIVLSACREPAILRVVGVARMRSPHTGSARLALVLMPVFVAADGCGGAVTIEGGAGGASSSSPAGGGGSAGGTVHGGGSLPAGDECLVVVTMAQGHTDPNDPCGLCITWANSTCVETSDVTNPTGPCGPANHCVASHCQCVPIDCTAATCDCIDDCLWTAPSSCVDAYVAYFGCLKDACAATCAS